MTAWCSVHAMCRGVFPVPARAHVAPARKSAPAVSTSPRGSTLPSAARRRRARWRRWGRRRARAGKAPPPAATPPRRPPGAWRRPRRARPRRTARPRRSGASRATRRRPPRRLREACTSEAASRAARDPPRDPPRPEASPRSYVRLPGKPQEASAPSRGASPAASASTAASPSGGRRRRAPRPDASSVAPTGFSAAGGSPEGASAAFGSAIVGTAWAYARGAGQRARGGRVCVAGAGRPRGSRRRGPGDAKRGIPELGFADADAREGARETSRGSARVAHTHLRLRWSSLRGPGAVPARGAMRAKPGSREDTRSAVFRKGDCGFLEIDERVRFELDDWLLLSWTTNFAVICFSRSRTPPGVPPPTPPP